MADREKVIQGLEHCGKQMDCDGCPYDADMGECFSLLKADAIELLKEQEPVKPIRLENWWECPSCNGNIVANMKYCPNCGKAVKWDGDI